MALFFVGSTIRHPTLRLRGDASSPFATSENYQNTYARALEDESYG